MEHRWTDQEQYLISQRAWELAIQGRYPEAGVLLEGLAAIAPGNLWLGRTLATVQIRLGKPEAALRALDALEDAPSRRLRFEALVALGRIPDAAAELSALRPHLDPPAARRCTLLIEATRGSVRR
jgi:predicted Zn-dependent protease